MSNLASKRQTTKSQKHYAVDMLNLPIQKGLATLALPIMATSLIQMAYNFTDMFWVGRLGAKAVAAVGTGGLFTWLSDSLMHLARMGGQVLSAQSLGANDSAKARRYANTSLQIGLILSLLYGLVIVLFNPHIVAFFGFHDTHTILWTQHYLALTGGLAFIPILSRILTGLMTASGNTRTPFRVTSLGLMLNILLDPLFIFSLNLGVVGAALSTIIAQSVVLLLFIFNCKHVTNLQDIRLFKFYKGLYQQILKIGIPSCLETLFYSSTSIVISHFVAAYGDFAVAAQRIGTQIETLCTLNAEGLANAINAFIAQHVGAKKLNRAAAGYRHAIFYMCTIGLVVSIILWFGSESLIRLFVNDPQTIRVGKQYLKIIAYSQVFMGIELVSYGAYCGYGENFKPALIIVGFTLIRIPLALCLMKVLPDVDGVWWALTISSILKGCLLTARYPRFRRRFEYNMHLRQTLKR